MEDITFHIKGKFKLHGFTMYDVIFEQEKFVIDISDRSVCYVTFEYDNKWRHPLLIDIKEKLQDMYGISIKNAILNLYNDGDDHDIYHSCSRENNGIFIVSIGGTRIFLTRNKSSGIVTKYLLEDGDLFFFNNEFNIHNEYSLPRVKNLKTPTITIVFFIQFN